MALIIADPCSLGTNITPEGVVLQVSQVEGFEGHKLMVPISWESWDELVATVEKDRKLRGPRIQPATINDMAQEAGRHAPR